MFLSRTGLITRATGRNYGTAWCILILLRNGIGPTATMTHKTLFLFVLPVALIACQSEGSVEARVQEHLHDLPSGKWIDKDGAKICDGYLTRRADQDFCAAEIPADWVPFEFDGTTYYIQPLAGQDL